VLGFASKGMRQAVHICTPRTTTIYESLNPSRDPEPASFLK